MPDRDKNEKKGVKRLNVSHNTVKNRNLKYFNFYVDPKQNSLQRCYSIPIESSIYKANCELTFFPIHETYNHIPSVESQTESLQVRFVPSFASLVPEYIVSCSDELVTMSLRQLLGVYNGLLSWNEKFSLVLFLGEGKTIYGTYVSTVRL